jgi:manganese oxidase
MTRSFRLRPGLGALFVAAAFLATIPGMAEAQTCARNITADVVALDQVFFWNRLGAVQPQGMIYALRGDVVSSSSSTTALSAGNVQLRPGKRPRPLVLRMNVGDCLTINFQNLLSPSRRDSEQPNTRNASVHVMGLNWTTSHVDDGSYVGQNPSSGIVAPGGSAVYKLYAEREGEHLLYSAGATTGGEGNGGSLNAGLFGAVVVEPANSVWYRSQVTERDMAAATTGTTSTTGHPIINFNATYASGKPILRILDAGNNIVHSDVTAIIAGTGANGRISPNPYPANVTNPERDQPFREFVTIYHDEIGAVQAFPEFENAVLSHTLHSGRDGFAINYGAAGIGAEVLANRLKVGPMHNCTECKFEEFFLTSWVVGDPAMVVDVPANAPCLNPTADPNNARSETGFSSKVNTLHSDWSTTPPCTPTQGPKATKAFFPDDPSNTYHSYLGDHTKFRVLHAGSKEHHIHHLHAHQWLYAPDNDNSSYLDSQALGPGTGFTAEIAKGGSGNQNLTPGDSIFHCHFYPHFAQGMWALWRVNDVFQKGSVMETDGRVALNTRAYPDGEITRGTPIPGVVPLPGKPMAPLPGAAVTISSTGQAVVTGSGNPGFPFFIPAVAGHRPPKPPLDTIDDGGLPRHIITNGTFVEAHTRHDFHKELLTAVAQPLAETGTAVEQAAMNFHATRNHPTCLPDGTNCGTVNFTTNGRPGIAGAPIADPCIDANGTPVGSPRLYKIADIQDDVKINKRGWHFSQQRFISLWEDVDDFLGLNGISPKKAPEPLFFRANSNDCITVHFTNLVPKEYLLDDFQVRTPTDILGQHIHLVKFDVLASDGAANGWNYEDASFSPGEVKERIAAIRAQNGCTSTDTRNGTFACPTARPHPKFGTGPTGEFTGAQTTVQRWYADPIRNNAGVDRTLRTVFTHDHYGPSTHQQVGLYAGLVIEPTGSTWFHNETGVQLGTNTGPNGDGGPTSWQAVIDAPNEPDYREFLLAFSDFQLAYPRETTTYPSPSTAIGPPVRDEIGLPDLLIRAPQCPGGVPLPCPELLSAAEPGTMSVNYRNEPLALRLRNPTTNSQATGQAGDPSFAFANLARADTMFNLQPTWYTPLNQGLLPRDPWTPMMRAYENDRVQIRILVGGQEEGHNFNVHGIKWLQEPSNTNSGYRNSQMMGISEHFEFIVPQIIKKPSLNSVDRLWSAGSSSDDLWNGLWGLFRAYTNVRTDLKALPDNPTGSHPVDPSASGAFDFSCPKDAPIREFSVTAVSAQQVLPGGRLVYNSRADGSFGPRFDPTAILYMHTADVVLNASGVPVGLQPNTPVEPLVIRAASGDCVKVVLYNKLPGDSTVNNLLDLDGYNTFPMIIDRFNANDVKVSNAVGLHPQMLYYDVSRYDGLNVGANLTQTIYPGQQTTYYWYAGDVKVNADGSVTTTPIEFGATNLMSSDRLEHASKGAFGALIIEPLGATWTPDANRRTAATVNTGNGSFREFITMFQNDVNMRTDTEMPILCPGNTSGMVAGHGAPVEHLHCEEDPEDTGQKAVNFRTEPLWKRMQHAPGTSLETTRDLTTWSDVVHNSKVGGDPQTPVFTANRGQAVRFRVLSPGGHSRNMVFALHGHSWDVQPYINNSTALGFNSTSLWQGSRFGHGPSNHFDALLRGGAGGKFSIAGDYLFRDQASFGFDGGMWGILRVLP